jgi:hypothetical protein
VSPAIAGLAAPIGGQASSSWDATYSTVAAQRPERAGASTTSTGSRGRDCSFLAHGTHDGAPVGTLELALVDAPFAADRPDRVP